MKPAIRRIGVVAAVVVPLAIAGYWLLPTRAASAPAAATAVPLEFSVADVTDAGAVRLTRSLAFSGALQPLTQATLKSKVAGDVLALRVREGQAVRQGDLLVSINPNNLLAQRDAAAATLEKARAELSIAGKNRQNNASLLARNFISQNAFDAAHSQFEAASASARAAEAQLALAQIALRDAEVRSPLAGTVSRRFVQVGEKVAVDTPLVAIVDLSRMEIEAPLAATEVASVRVGQTARFRVDGFGSREFEGRVERINPVAESGSRSITVYLSVANPDQALRGGMFAQGTIALDQTPPVVALPITALREEAGVHFVMAIEDGKLARKDVTPGLRDEAQGLVEIRSGLAAAALVVKSRIAGLKAGAAAIVKPPAGKS